MGGLAACAGGAGIGALAFLALRGLLAFGAFFSKARKARSARSVAARSVASATRQLTDAAADSLRVDGGRGAGSGSVSERRNAFVAGKYSSVVAILSCVEPLAEASLAGAAAGCCSWDRSCVSPRCACPFESALVRLSLCYVG